MNYSRSSVDSLLRRLRSYAGYVGCGCSGLKQGDKCKGAAWCARGDYRRIVLALRKKLGGPASSSGRAGT